MFSTITTEESTNIPIAITSPPKLIKLADKSNSFISIKVINADIGKESATTNDERISPRKIASNMMTNITAWLNALVMVLIAVLIRLDLS